MNETKENLLHKYRDFAELSIVFVEYEIERHPNNEHKIINLYQEIQALENQMEEGD